MRLRPFTVGIAAIALLLAACGDDDDTTTTAPATETETDTETEAETGASSDADLQDYADALATSFKEDPDNQDLGLADEEIDCFADDAVEVIGLDRLQEQGTPEELVDDTDIDLTELRLEEDERTEIAQSLFSCSDGLVERLQEQLVAETGLEGEQAACVADLFTEEVLIEVFSASLSGDDESQIFSDLEDEFQACTGEG